MNKTKPVTENSYRFSLYLNFIYGYCAFYWQFSLHVLQLFFLASFQCAVLSK